MLYNLMIPLSPLSEQKRIVAKSEEILPYCQQLINNVEKSRDSNAIVLAQLKGGFMSMICEIIIAGLGVIVACLQIRLSKQINEQNISRDKGYFIVEETNIREKKDSDYKRCIGIFDLKTPLHFQLYGNSDVFLLKEQVKINGIIKDSKELLETFFSLYSQESPYGILLPLNEKDKEADRLDIDILLILKNINGYTYTEEISLVFSNNSSYDWILKKKNIKLGELRHKIRT